MLAQFALGRTRNDKAVCRLLFLRVKPKLEGVLRWNCESHEEIVPVVGSIRQDVSLECPKYHG